MMAITIIAVGNKMPGWVNQATLEFTKRLADRMRLSIIQLPLVNRGKSADLARIMQKEAQAIRSSIPHSAYTIALDIQGTTFSSEQLASKFDRLRHTAHHLCFLIGGPEGLSPEILEQTNERWSLSKLTLPHPLARIVLLEAVYRAWCISHKHPYHK